MPCIKPRSRLQRNRILQLELSIPVTSRQRHTNVVQGSLRPRCALAVEPLGGAASGRLDTERFSWRRDKLARLLASVLLPRSLPSHNHTLASPSMVPIAAIPRALAPARLSTSIPRTACRCPGGSVVGRLPTCRLLRLLRLDDGRVGSRGARAGEGEYGFLGFCSG